MWMFILNLRKRIEEKLKIVDRTLIKIKVSLDEVSRMEMST